MPHQNSLYGLILIGGRSSRMHKDKAALNYHGKEHALYCYELLEAICERVFISCRRDQAATDWLKGCDLIFDEPPFTDIGPLGGIMSAMTEYPDQAFLVLACDLPFISQATIAYLLDHRNPKKIATVYRSAHDGLPEPLCAIYERQALAVLRTFLDQDMHCPRKILSNSDAELLTLNEEDSLDNVNSLDEYKQAIEQLKNKS